MTTKITPVILCGGSGTRLWPLSRPKKPKPFLPLLGEKSLFEETLARVSEPNLFAPPVIVAGAAHVALIEEQLAGRPAHIIVEPAARNTAPAIALAALWVKSGPMLVCPSDHHIADTAAFHAAVRVALTGAEAGRLMTFGIAASHPETGYGYLERGRALSEGVYEVARFEEKPALPRARAFVASGRHSWNGGLFLFDAGQFLEELSTQRPAITEGCTNAMDATINDGLRVHPDADAFAAIKGESVDYAVMENSRAVAMVEADMGWSDIGSFASLAEHLGRDANHNAARGRVDIVGGQNLTVLAGGKRVSVAGVDDLIIVVDGDDIMITRAPSAQLVGQLPGAKGE
jgi:mannose-1-phosphate guanylyltransferase